MKKNFDNIMVIPYKKQERSEVGKRTSHFEAPNGWEKDIGFSKINFDKPVVLCLGGTGIDTDKDANGVAKRVQELLGLKDDVNDDKIKQVQLLSVVYPSDLRRLSMERDKFKRGEKRERLDYIEGIYDTVFRPIILPNGKPFDIKNIEEVIRKFRNITVFSHCHGSFVACELVSYLQQDLKNIVRISDKDSQNILKEITSIMLSPRDGVRRCGGSLNIGFTFAADNLLGVEEASVRKGYVSEEVWNLSNKLQFGGIKGSDTFYHKFSKLHNFWDTDTFCADIEFVETYGDGMYGVSKLVYESMYAVETPYFHLFENYCSMFAKYDDDSVGFLRKNAKGQNFTKMIAKSLQNAVSLSIKGKERTLENIVSNETECAFEQGDEKNNLHFKNVKFQGDLKTFMDNGRKVLPPQSKKRNSQLQNLPEKDVNMQKIIEEVRVNTI